MIAYAAEKPSISNRDTRSVAVIKNLDNAITEHMCRDIFSALGRIISVRLEPQGERYVELHLKFVYPDSFSVLAKCRGGPEENERCLFRW